MPMREQRTHGLADRVAACSNRGERQAPRQQREVLNCGEELAGLTDLSNKD